MKGLFPEVAVNKSKFDVVLRRLAVSKPVTFREVVDKPKPKKDGGIKRSKAARPKDTS